MKNDQVKFEIFLASDDERYTIVGKDSILMGRLDTCEIVLADNAVSRIHAGLNFTDGKYSLVNLSSSNIITLNGRRLGPQKQDILADGDLVQIGPFTLRISRTDAALAIDIELQEVSVSTTNAPAMEITPSSSGGQAAGVLQAFWEKRSREKEDWGSRLRPTKPPKPGKAMYNWRPTRDLRRPWRYAIFFWTFLIIGSLGAYAFFRHPGVYAPQPLTAAHSGHFESPLIAAQSNGNSCTTCHTPNEPVENSCIKCHQAEQFHASNTKAHEEAGVTCTVCHQEHRGPDFDMSASAIASCSTCHSDDNPKTYNGKIVRTAHSGSYGYPASDGVWKWRGVYREVSNAIPEINSSATGDRDEQAKLSRQFHTIHVARLRVPQGIDGDANGLVSCSTCHKSFDPIDRSTPRETCAACHTNPGEASGRDQRFGTNSVNCISCHVQHPFSVGRWDEFLTADALNRRRSAVAEQIKRISSP